jgi:crotonobetainyl-CoA:carnitine CoA-transferase CaiB-like acyl-CoA transferase
MTATAPPFEGAGLDDLPLAGVKVLEFSQNVMGPCAGLLLADLGAEVIKIEGTPKGDPTRYLSGFASGMFAFYNRNKRSAAIDCKSPEGKRLVHQLAAQADVVIENFAAGAMERLGCDWPTLSQINPRLIYLTLKGFLSGPYENRAALDEVVQFMGGLAYMTGPLGQPLRAGASVTDIMGGTFGASAVLAALYQRERSGRGRLIKSALFESVAFMMGQFMAGVARQGRDMPPMPNRESSWPVYDTFKTADGEILFIAATSDKQWDRFLDSFGIDELKGDPRLTSREERMAARSWTIPIIAAKLATFRKDEIARRCEEIGCGWAHTAKPSDLFEDPQLNAGHLVDVAIYGKTAPHAEPKMLYTKLPRLPLEVDGETLRNHRQPPYHGEHTREVLADIGITGDAFEQLLQAGVVQEAQLPDLAVQGAATPSDGTA